MFVQLKGEWLGHKAGERLDVDEDQAKLLVSKGLAEILPDNHPVNELISKTLEHAHQEMGKQLSGIINHALKEFATAQQSSKKAGTPIIFGDQKADKNHCFGDWLLHVAQQDDAYLEKTYGSLKTKAAMAEGSGTTGGYTVPPEFYTQLQTLIAEEAIIRPRAFVQPMAHATLAFPFLDVSTAQAAGTTPFFGGVSMTWTEEAQTRTETEPAFKMMELKAHELSGYAVSSNVLIQDSLFGLEKFLMALFSKAIAWFEDYAFLQGNGVGKPLGMLSCNAKINVTRNAANSFKYVDAANMLAKLLPSSQQKAVWVIHPYVIPQLVQMADASGRVVWVPNSSGAEGRLPGTLFGRPVLTTEKVPALGTAGDVSLLDPSLYVIGDRMQVEIAASEHVNFLKNQMTWRVVERVDGQPWLDRAITLQDAVSTVSPFVALN